MIIAVHDSRRKSNSRESKFFYKLVDRLSGKYANSLFYLISPALTPQNPSENLKFLKVDEPAFPLLRKKRYNNKIAHILEHLSIDILISDDGNFYWNTNVPHCLIVHESSEMQKYSIKNLDAALSIVVSNETIKAKLVSTYHINPNKIHNVHFGIGDEIQPLNFEEQFIVKEDNTEGKEYFLASYPADENILVALLKAFSIFKKRQQTNMMLLIAANDTSITDRFNSILQNYKYRDDVMLKYSRATKHGYDLMAAAYAYIDIQPHSLISIAEAMKSGVPVLTSEEAKELTGTAALFIDAHDQQQMAEQMMLIYKDENLRNELIKKASLIAFDYTWDRTATLLWKVLNENMKLKNVNQE